MHALLNPAPRARAFALYTPHQNRPQLSTLPYLFYKKNKINLINYPILYIVEFLKTYNMISEGTCSKVFA
jgi:hypothetical protein